jgi:hypothetical protein
MPIYEFKCPNGTITEKFVKMGTKEIICSKGGKMKFNEIRAMACDLGINTYRKKKIDLVRAIQKTENNIACYGTERVEYCNEPECLWRSDCLSLNKGKLI